MSKSSYYKGVKEKRIVLKNSANFNKQEKTNKIVVNKNMTTHTFEEDYPYLLVTHPIQTQQPKRSRIVVKKQKLTLSELENN